MAIDWLVVGWVGEDQPDLPTLQQAIIVSWIPRITAEQGVVAEALEITRARDSVLGHVGDAIGGAVVRPRLLLPCQVEGEIHLRQTEAGQLHLEAGVDEFLELQGEEVLRGANRLWRDGGLLYPPPFR